MHVHLPDKNQLQSFQNFPKLSDHILAATNKAANLIQLLQTLRKTISYVLRTKRYALSADRSHPNCTRSQHHRAYANLGLPADIYHLYLMARQVELPLKSITLDLGNVHIYENNIDRTLELLSGVENIKFDLNV